MGIVRGAGVIRWGASDGHSPYIGENGNWWQWNETVGDFVDTGVSAKGVDGMPGQVPIQKEWKEGDTHRNDTNIVDFIYVRSALAENRKWYKLNDTYITRTVPAGETEPSAATIAEYYEEIPWLSALAVNVLIAEEANLANFIFKEGKLISIRGTVNGVAADYAGQANFIPNIVLDGKTGSGQLSGGNIKWNAAGNIEFLGGVKSPFVDVSEATIPSFWEDEITSWANNFFENQTTNVLIIRIIPCSNLLNGQVFRIHALRKGITLQPEVYNGFYDNGTLLNEIQLLKGDAIEMVCICYDGNFHSWDIIKRYKCRPYDQ